MGLETRDQVDTDPTAIRFPFLGEPIECRLHHQRDQKVLSKSKFDAFEFLRSNADHGEGQTVHIDRLTNDRRVQVEAASPEIMTKHDDGMCELDLAFLWRERASQDGFDLEHV